MKIFALQSIFLLNDNYAILKFRTCDSREVMELIYTAECARHMSIGAEYAFELKPYNV